MRMLVLSLQRLYEKKKVTKEKIDSLLAAGKITEDEHTYILS